jgi:hypothetical protein
VSRVGKNSSSHFCYCLTRAEAAVRPAIVMEKDVFYVLVRMSCADVLLQFV